MNRFIPRFSFLNRTLLVLGIAGLVTIFTGIVFVAAHDDSAQVVTRNDTLTPDSSTKAKIAKGFGKLPLNFEINKGQVDPQVKFLSRELVTNCFSPPPKLSSRFINLQLLPQTTRKH